MASAGPSSTTAAAAAPSATNPSLESLWSTAKNWRDAVSREIHIIQDGGPKTNELARFEKIEKLMENFRLGCVSIIFTNLVEADKMGIEGSLWTVHANINKTYREVISRLQGPDHAVTRRKVEKLYQANLKTTQFFYKGFLQRVYSLHDVKELRRIAHLVKLEGTSNPPENFVGSEEVATTLCHSFLIHLGDLSRYRTSARSKDRNWDVALTYYELANELKPGSGLGWHQSSVVFIEALNLLQVIYHLYRSLACDQPHPLASVNLERIFRDIQKEKGNLVKNTTIPLVSWFAKLHACYFQGKGFSAQQELEKEVDHQLSLKMKSGTDTDLDANVDVLKMVLININAYVVARSKIQEEWTEEKSRSCQFILSLNVRTIRTISILLKDELHDLFKRQDAALEAAGSSAGQEAGAPLTLTARTQRLLPLLRVYMAWLCSYADELAGFRDHLDQFDVMCKTLSQALSYLFRYFFGSQQQGKPVSWQLPEDVETLGIRCLNGSDMLSGCQLNHDAITGKAKPRRDEVSETEHTTDDITYTRGIDIALCAMNLAQKTKFPFTLSTSTKTPTVYQVVYLENGKLEPLSEPQPAPMSPSTVQYTTPPTSMTPTVSSTPAAPAAPAVPVALAAPAAAAIPAVSAVPAGVPTSSTPVTTSFGTSGLAPPGLPTPMGSAYGKRQVYGSGYGNSASFAAPRDSRAAATNEFPLEKQLFDYLDKLVGGPQPAKPTVQASTPLKEEVSWGTENGTTWDSAAAAASTSPGPGSATGKAFPILPWHSAWGTDGSLSRPGSSGNTQRAPGGFAAIYGAGQQSFMGDSVRKIWQDNGASPAGHARTGSNPQVSQNSPYTMSGQQSFVASPFSSLAFSDTTSSLPTVNSPRGLPTRPPPGFANLTPQAAEQSPSANARHAYGASENTYISSVATYPSSAAAFSTYGTGSPTYAFADQGMRPGYNFVPFTAVPTLGNIHQGRRQELSTTTAAHPMAASTTWGPMPSNAPKR